MTDTVALIVGLILTLFVYSYLLGDNPLFRIAVHLLVGVSAAYAAVVAVNLILAPVIIRLLSNPAAPENVSWLIPVLLSLLLFTKWFRSLSWLGNTAVGYLVTIGAAIALVGAVTGTVVPQLTSIRGDGVINIILTALFAVSVLLYFQFTSKRDQESPPSPNLWQRPVRAVGHAVLMVTFGAVFAGLFTTSLILLIERVNFFVRGLATLIGLILL